MMRLLFIVINAVKFFLWYEAILLYVHYFGIWLGAALIIASAFGWNIYASAIGNYRRRQNAWIVLGRLFTSKFWLPFLAYGNYCGPGWGDDSPNKGLEPISGFDYAGLYHDIDMENAKKENDPVKRRRLKNRGDLIFIGRAWTSDNSAHGFEVPGATIGFLIRIISRSIWRQA